MIPEQQDSVYCLILDHNRFQENPLATVFQNQQLPELVRLFDGTLLDEVAEEGPWCVWLTVESPFIADQLLEQLWGDDRYWRAGSCLVVGTPGQDRQSLLAWLHSRALALSPSGNLSVFRFYSPAVLSHVADRVSVEEQYRLIAGAGSVVWATGQLHAADNSSPSTVLSNYQLPEALFSGLME